MIQCIESADPDMLTDERLIESFIGHFEKSDAPMAHKFAVGVSEVSEEDVANELARDKDCLDSLFRGCTPLDLAIVADNVKGLDWLLRMGADPNTNSGMKCYWRPFVEDNHSGKIQHYARTNLLTNSA